MTQQHDPLFLQDDQQRCEQVRLAELHEQWNDAFLDFCALPSSHDYDQERMKWIERLNAIEAQEAKVLP